MARGIHRLTAPEVKAAKAPAVLNDGGGLYCSIKEGTDDAKTPQRAWLFRYTSPATAKRRWMGLGSADLVTLKAARDAADAARKKVQAGIDPIEARRGAKATAAVEAARSITFRQAAASYIKAQTPSWRSPKHPKLWAASMEAYAYEHIGALPVAAIDVALVLKVLEPIWATKPETASRVRQRIEAVLDWACARGLRPRGDNPARWRGHMQHLLPARSKPVEHHAALPFAKVGAFTAQLREQHSDGAEALALTIFCVTRTTETLSAEWPEFDLAESVWEIPAARMKANRPHRIPLNRQAVAILKARKQAARKGARYVFPGLGTPRRPLSGMAMLAVLKRMGLQGTVTPHGFRSSFRTWAQERTSFARDICEAALAHTLGSKTELAYARGDLFDKRRRLMQSWADYIDSTAKSAVGAVVSMRASEGSG